jgi:hypothetical protein
MIDRSYLPFNSAKHYQDPGMQKWMGFFLSEHTASLKDEENKDCFTSELSLVDKMTFVTQLYASQMIGQFTVRKKDRRRVINGVIKEVVGQSIIIKEEDTHYRLSLDDVLNIRATEEDFDE